MKKTLMTALVASVIAGTAWAQSAVEVDRDKLAKGADAAKTLEAAEAMTAAMADSAGFVIVILDKDGGQRGGNVAVKSGTPQWDSIKTVVDGLIATNKTKAETDLGSAGFTLKPRAADAPVAPR